MELKKLVFPAPQFKYKWKDFDTDLFWLPIPNCSWEQLHDIFTSIENFYNNLEKPSPKCGTIKQKSKRYVEMSSFSDIPLEFQNQSVSNFSNNNIKIAPPLNKFHFDDSDIAGDIDEGKSAIRFNDTNHNLLFSPLNSDREKCYIVEEKNTINRIPIFDTLNTQNNNPPKLNEKLQLVPVKKELSEKKKDDDFLGIDWNDINQKFWNWFDNDATQTNNVGLEKLLEMEKEVNGRDNIIHNNQYKYNYHSGNIGKKLGDDTLSPSMHSTIRSISKSRIRPISIDITINRKKDVDIDFLRRSSSYRNMYNSQETTNEKTLVALKKAELYGQIIKNRKSRVHNFMNGQRNSHVSLKSGCSLNINLGEVIF